MRLLGYIRVSTEEQAEGGQSLAIQDLQLARYCELYGHELVDVIADEGISASVPLEKRTGGSQVLDRLKDGEADGFVVQRLDRAFRLTIDGLVTADWFNRRGLTIHSVHEHIDTNSSMGRYFLTLLLANAQLERDRTCDRATETYKGLLAQGKVYGPVPFGCVRDGDRLYRNPGEWGVREWIVQQHAAGMSLRKVSYALRERGILAPAGGTLWHINTIKGIVDTHDDLKDIPLYEPNNEAPASVDGVRE